MDEASHEDDNDEIIELDDDEAEGNIDDVDDDNMDDEEEELEEIKDDSRCTFALHNGPVFCVKLNPMNNVIVATGGQDDMAYVWNSSTTDVMLECTGHKDSVTHVGFSPDGILLASGDMSGLIKVWNISTKEELWSYEVADLEWLDWHFGANVLFASDAEGTVWMWRIPSGQCKTFSNTGLKAACCCLLADGESLCAGYSNGTLKIWDLKTGSVRVIMTGNEGHEQQVTCIDSVSTATVKDLLVSGSEDGKVNVYNIKSGKLLKTYDCNQADTQCSVETVSICSSRPLVAAGSTNGFIFIYELQTQSCRHKINNEQAVVKVQWQYESPLLYAVDVAGVVSLWDGRTGESTAKFYGHAAAILDLDVSRFAIEFATSSEDGTAKVYSVENSSSSDSF